MKIAGIICEYNPFHLGHRNQIEKTREAGNTHVIAVMSGNFVQRGEAAIISKFARAGSALESGVDLVIELPTAFVLSSAETFARSGIYLLDALRVVDTLSFGSESGSIEKIKDMLTICKSQIFKDKLKSGLNLGMSFAKAQQDAFEKILGKDTADILKKPNDMLALEYLKAIDELNSAINPLCIKRNEDETLRSSYMRNLIFQNKFKELKNKVSESSFEKILSEISNKNGPNSLEMHERIVLYKLLNMSKDEISEILGVNEGLENRIYEGVRMCASLEELYSYIKSKRYTHARIRRIILAAFLGVTKKYRNINPQYIRVLGFNEEGRKILNAAKGKAVLPILTRITDKYDEDQIKFDRIYGLIKPELKKFKLEQVINEKKMHSCGS